MPLEIACDRCTLQCTVPDAFAGREMRCPRCQATLRAPGAPVAGPTPAPLIDMLAEELGDPATGGAADPFLQHAPRSRKFRLSEGKALGAAIAGVFSLFVLVVVLLPSAGLVFGGAIVAAGALGVFVGICWLLYLLFFVPAHRRRAGPPWLTALGGLGACGIAALGIVYDRHRLAPPEPVAALPPAAATPEEAPAKPRTEKDDVKPAAVAKTEGTRKSSTQSPAAPSELNDPAPAKDLVSFDPKAFGKGPRQEAVAGPPPAEPELSPFELAYEESSRAYAAAAAADLLAVDDESFKQRLYWFPAAARPAMGLRWALGVQAPEGNPPPPTSREAEKQAAALSLALVRGLEQRGGLRAFGVWPSEGDPRLRQVAVLRNGQITKADELRAAARRQGLDLLVAVVPQGASSAMRAVVVDLLDDQTLGAFPDPHRPKGPAKGPVEALAKEVLDFVDEKCTLKPIPWLILDEAKKRMEVLARGAPRGNPLALLVETRFYHARKLLSDEAAARLYDEALGPGKGAEFAAADPPGRRALVQAWAGVP